VLPAGVGVGRVLLAVMRARIPPIPKRLNEGATTLLASRYTPALWCVIAVGVVVRLVLAFSTDGVKYDLESVRIVTDALIHSPSHVYAIADGSGVSRWPYPPGFFVFILAAKAVSHLTGLQLLSLTRIPSIVADAAIAWLVQDFLRHRGYDRRTRLAAAALVALGPSFIAISGHHGQMDALAILPAVAALSVWERADERRRAYLAGALIGAGAAIKSVPIFMLLALLPSVSSRREAIRLVASAGAVVALSFLPFIVLDGTGWLDYLRYNGRGGLGSISLVVQPSLALDWFGLAGSPMSDASQFLSDHARLIAGSALLLVAAFVFRFRARAPLAAAMIWLAVYAFGVTFFMQYIVWGLPFFLMAGYIRQVFLLEAALLAPVLIVYLGASHAWVADALYVAPMLALWVISIVALALAGRRVLAENRELPLVAT
jgi:uncharacterized membrane protein